jgi:zinc transport system substrate-binding protein
VRYLLFLLFLQAATASAAPRVVTSIAPIQELTAALMAGVAAPVSIIDARSSAHHFALRPSHMRLLQQADLVIWIGSDFEAGLQRIAQTLPAGTARLELLPALGIDGEDGHIWYSTRRLLQVVDVVGAELARIDPANRQRYRANADALSGAIADWRSETVRLMGERQPRFITDHAFTSHLEADLGYAPIAAIHDRHDAHSGLRELGRIEERLRRQPAKCLLTQESPPAPLALELARKYRLEIIDLAAPAAAGGPQPAIIQRLLRLRSALLECS